MHPDHRVQTMSQSPIGNRILKLFGLSPNKSKSRNRNRVPINLYTNFYFKVEPKSDEEESDGRGNEATIFETIDFSKQRLTTENVRKVKRLHKSKSVEDWLNNIEDNEEVKDVKVSNEIHYACVDVTNKSFTEYDQPRLFAKSNVIFKSYSSLSTFKSSNSSFEIN